MATKTGEVNYLQKGEQGDIGPLVYPAGEYASDASYTRTAFSAPMVLCEGQYYVLSKEGTFKGINPKTDYAANGSKATWVLMDRVQYAFIDILMANFAKLDSAVFYDGCMFSQEGVDADGNKTTDYREFGTSAFTPNILMNFMNGFSSFINTEIRGSLSFPYQILWLNDGDNNLNLSNGRYFYAKYSGMGNSTIVLPSPTIKYSGSQVRIYSGFKISRAEPDAFYLKIAGGGIYYPGYRPAVDRRIEKIFVQAKEIVLMCISVDQRQFWYLENYRDFASNDFTLASSL